MPREHSYDLIDIVGPQHAEGAASVGHGSRLGAVRLQYQEVGIDNKAYAHEPI